jgi:26S proteasome non-ATPase regulatory subunit 9
MSAEQLLKEKDSIEQEIMELNRWFETSRFGKTGPLVDAEGFPFPEVDLVIETRTKRHRYSCLQNDYSDIMRRVEAIVLPSNSTATTATTATTSTTTATSADTPTASASPSPPLLPFAVIDEVMASSPAEEAGLRANDRVVRFGRINLNTQPTSQSAMLAVRDLVNASENRRIALVVERTVASTTTTDHSPSQQQQQLVVIGLTPRRWKGQGLLGCHLRPF